MSVATFTNLIGTLRAEIKKDALSLHSAAIAYYTIFSIIPLLVLAIIVGGVFFGQGGGWALLAELLDTYFGPIGVSFLTQVTTWFDSSLAAGRIALVGLAVLLYGGVNLFSSVRKAFGLIFNFITSVSEDGLIDDTINHHAWSIVYLSVLLIFIFVFAFLNVILNVVLYWAAEFIWPSFPASWLSLLNYGPILAATIAILAIIYRFSSLKRLSWANACWGAVVGSVLFSLINTLLGWYVSISLLVPVYGGASFLVVFLLWSYYVALAILVGAETAKILECRYPRHRQKICL